MNISPKWGWIAKTIGGGAALVWALIVLLNGKLIVYQFMQSNIMGGIVLVVMYVLPPILGTVYSINLPIRYLGKGKTGVAITVSVLMLLFSLMAAVLEIFVVSG